jgi:hypothetical protein
MEANLLLDIAWCAYLMVSMKMKEKTCRCSLKRCLSSIPFKKHHKEIVFSFDKKTLTSCLLMEDHLPCGPRHWVSERGKKSMQNVLDTLKRKWLKRGNKEIEKSNILLSQAHRHTHTDRQTDRFHWIRTSELNCRMRSISNFIVEALRHQIYCQSSQRYRERGR